MAINLSRRIHDEIEARILAGSWPPGHRIPTERELTEEYDCSRMTVNKALSQLAREGYIARNKRAGSVVIRPHTQSAVMEIHQVRDEVASLGLEYEYRLRSDSVRPATGDETRRFGLDSGSEWRAVVAVHIAGKRPFCLEERLVNLAVVPEAADAPFEVEPVGTWLLGHVPWSEAEHSVSADGACDLAADALGIAPGSPCLVVERQTRHADRFVTWVRLTYAGGTHTLIARFTPARPDLPGGQS